MSTKKKPATKSRKPTTGGGTNPEPLGHEPGTITNAGLIPNPLKTPDDDKGKGKDRLGHTLARPAPSTRAKPKRKKNR